MDSYSCDYFLPPREKVGGPVVSFDTVGVLPNDGAGDGNGVSKFSGVVGANVRSSGPVGSPVTTSGGGIGIQMFTTSHGNWPPKLALQQADSLSNCPLPVPILGSLVQTPST